MSGPFFTSKATKAKETHSVDKSSHVSITSSSFLSGSELCLHNLCTQESKYLLKLSLSMPAEQLLLLYFGLFPISEHPDFTEMCKILITFQSQE